MLTAVKKKNYKNANFPVDEEGRTYHLGTKVCHSPCAAPTPGLQSAHAAKYMPWNRGEHAGNFVDARRKGRWPTAYCLLVLRSVPSCSANTWSPRHPAGRCLSMRAVEAS
jgi:hypothetical protein